MIKALFLDRDGIINPDLEGYVESADQFTMLPGVAQAIRLLNDAGVLTVIISNQQGVGRKVMTQQALDGITQRMRDILSEQAGAHLDDVFYCTHLKDEGCDCRKPKPGMILKALAKYSVLPDDTAFVGDTAGDMQAAANANVGKKILVLTGKHRYYRRSLFSVEPDFVFVDLSQAVSTLLEMNS
jgi:histidinol-phosphate phosphatase family protein